MPRRREVPKRYVLPDPKYNSKLVAKFVNNVMRRGKKSLAEQILYGALDLIAQRSKQDPL
ncbi:MAG: 30S ribosomal protein S7, partial [Desulfobacteraceae bacterium]|nr:30S ribosomal protein S7 [Desulfobacteraceae bacterium]